MERLTNIKLIVCDMDGTLLHDDQSLDTGIVEVGKQLVEQGIIFTLASGRNVHIMKQFINSLSLDVPYITNNGANIFLKDSCLFEQVIEHDDLYCILTLLEAFHLPFLAYTNTQLFGTREDASLEGFLQRLRGKVEIHLQATIDEIAQQEIFKIVVIQADEAQMQTFIQAVASGCNNAHCVRTEGHIYAMSNSSVSKGYALKKLLARLEIQSDQVVVFGDNYNDVSMFDVVEHSVAMANSSEEIRRHTRYLTKTNNENGVSYFIKKYIL